MTTANPNIRVSRAAFERMWLDPTVTTDQIAARFGIHRSTVTPVGKRFGLPPRKQGSKRHAIPAGFADMWAAGVRGADIAAHYGYSRNYLARVASNAGLPPRKQGGHYLMRLDDYLQVKMALSMARSARIEQAALINAEMVDDKRRIKRALAAGLRGAV